MPQTAAQQVLELTHPTAETTVLTAMRRGSVDDAVYLADTLHAADFADPRNRVAFQAMVNVLRGTEPLDDTAILAECPQVARDMRLDVKIDGGWLAGLVARRFFWFFAVYCGNFGWRTVSG